MGFGIKIIFLTLLCFIYRDTYSQEEVVNREKLTYSWGIGREHAGVGLSVLYYPKSLNLGFFGAIGYPAVGLSYSTGIKYRFYSKSQKSRFIPYSSLIYGYHRSFRTKSNNPLQTNTGKYDKIIIGPSISLGIDSGPKVLKKVYFSVGINYGFNNQEAEDYDEFLTSLGYKRVVNDDIYIPVSSPLSFIFGLRFILD